MRRELQLCCLLLIVGAALAISAGSARAATWKIYTDSTNQVSFRHPSDWKLDSSYYPGTYFAGQDGSVLVQAEGYDEPETTCQMEIGHKGSPFGTHPVTRHITVNGQQACLVWPSDDQQLVGISAANGLYALLVVQYPHPVRINGQDYLQVTVYATTRYIMKIMDSLKFIPLPETRH
jgi:TolB protein